jgi:prevent-host-death family protein
MRFASVRELKNSTSAVMREAQERDIVITSRGKPVVLLQPLSEADLEDYLFYSTAAIRRRIEGRWQQYQQTGKTVSLDAVRKRHAPRKG